MPSIFADADVIHTYTRAESLKDGSLVDISATAREAGINFPVAVSRAVWGTCIDLTPAAKRACNDVEGRTWDVVWMLRRAISAAPVGETVINYQVLAVTDRIRPSRVSLKAICGPGDDGEPVITILEPHED
jgi:hypothetical protein